MLVFFAAVFVYNFQRIFYKPTLDSSLISIRRKWIFNHQTSVKLLTIAGCTGVAVTFFFNNYKILLYLSPLLILSLLYFLPFVKLRRTPWLKLLTLVLVWTMVTSVVPLLLGGAELFTLKSFLHIILRFCFLTAICIPFDIRDIHIDKADLVTTVPQLIGENKARQLAMGFMFLYIILIIPEYLFGMVNLKIFIALIISAVINAVLVLMSSSNRSEYFYVAVIDGTMILQGLMLLLVYYL